MLPLACTLPAVSGESCSFPTERTGPVRVGRLLQSCNVMMRSTKPGCSGRLNWGSNSPFRTTWMGSILLDESIKYQMRIKWTSSLCFTSHLSDGSSDDRTGTWREHRGPRLREWLPDVGPPHLQDGDSPGCAGDQGTFSQSKFLLQISSRSNKSRVFSNF